MRTRRKIQPELAEQKASEKWTCPWKTREVGDGKVKGKKISESRTGNEKEMENKKSKKMKDSVASKC